MVVSFDRDDDCEKVLICPCRSFQVLPLSRCVLGAARKQTVFPLGAVRDDVVGCRVDDANDRCVMREIGRFWWRFESTDMQRLGTDMGTVETATIGGSRAT